MPKLWVTSTETVDPGSLAAEHAVQYASFILYKLTGEKYPGTETSTDYYQFDNGKIGYASAYESTLVDGEIRPIPVGQNTWTRSTELHLRSTPVVGIDSITINGQLVDPTLYRIVNHRYLIRLDRLPWAINAQDEIAVTYRHGTPPPRAGRMAALRLANELIYADAGDDRCTLPERITSITRQGTTIAMLDPQDFLQNGKTGIYVVDMFIKAANPNNAKKKPKVFSPDKPFGERRY